MPQHRLQFFSYEFDENGNRWLLYFGLAIVGLVIYISLTSKPIDADLIGVWKLESTQTNGMPPHRERSLWVFSQRGILIINDQETKRVGCSVDTTTLPRRMDIDFRFQPNGIYEVDGDTLRVAFSAFNMPRPTSFETTWGDLSSVSVFRRLNVDSDLPADQWQLVLLDEFGPPKAYPKRIEFDRAAEDFVGDLMARMPEQISESAKEGVLSQIAWLDTEVNNGGFHQFFYNFSGELAMETLESLRTIGSVETLGLLEEACNLFPDGKPPKDQTERHQALEQFTLEQHEVLDDLNERYYSRREDVHLLLRTYWEKESR